MSQVNYQGKIAYSGKTASTYEQSRIVETIWHKEQAWVDGYVRTLATETHLLDLPFGTGRFVDIYDKRQLQVIGVDISEDMLKVAKRRLNSTNRGRYELLQADSRYLSLRDGAVDGFICFRLIHLMPMEVIRPAVKEFARVSRKFVVIQAFDSSLIFENAGIVKRKALRVGLAAITRKLLPISASTFKMTYDKPWLTIENFSYRERELLDAFNDAGLSLQAIDLIKDESCPSRIYRLEKR